MSKQLSDAPLRPDEQIATSATTGSMPAVNVKKKQPAVFWPWLGMLLLVGLIIVGIATLSVWNWLNAIQSGNGAAQSSSAVSTVNVRRRASYADLNVTLVSVQEATSFSDDLIHTGPATVRVTLSVNNPTSNAIDIAYYDVARLLVPKQQPIAPTNLTLSAVPAARTTQTGWIDFPVAKNTALSTLKFQLGNASIGELLVTIPVSGAYNASQYDAHSYNKSVPITYTFKGWQQPVYNLYYHLTRIDVRNSYNGVETKAGQQYYVLYFTVDNPNGAWISPGTGYYYIRLVLNGGNRSPMDNTLPEAFKPNAHGVKGYVAFQGPAGMHNLNIFFLWESQPGGFNTPVSW